MRNSSQKPKADKAKQIRVTLPHNVREELQALADKRFTDVQGIITYLMVEYKERLGIAAAKSAPAPGNRAAKKAELEDPKFYLTQPCTLANAKKYKKRFSIKAPGFDGFTFVWVKTKFYDAFAYDGYHDVTGWGCSMMQPGYPTTIGVNRLPVSTEIIEKLLGDGLGYWNDPPRDWYPEMNTPDDPRIMQIWPRPA